MSDARFLSMLETVISARIEQGSDGSYTARLAQGGVLKVAQKVGEEGVELALAAAAQDDDRVAAEAADLLYHLLVLLKSRNLTLQDVVQELASRHSARG